MQRKDIPAVMVIAPGPPREIKDKVPRFRLCSEANPSINMAGLSFAELESNHKLFQNGRPELTHDTVDIADELLSVLDCIAAAAEHRLPSEHQVLVASPKPSPLTRQYAHSRSFFELQP